KIIAQRRAKDWSSLLIFGELLIPIGAQAMTNVNDGTRGLTGSCLPPISAEAITNANNGQRVLTDSCQTPISDPTMTNVNNGAKGLMGTWFNVVAPNTNDPTAPPPLYAVVTFTAD